MASYNPTTGTSAEGDVKEAAERALEKEKGRVTGAIGDRLDRAGDFLDEKGRAGFVADRLHRAGRYMQDNDARSVARSIDGAISNHPYRGILLGLGIGWVVGRFLSGRDRD